MTVRESTFAAIEEAHQYSAFYRGYLANHLPMALVALDAMGAEDARLAAFASRYCALLEPLGAPGEAIVSGDEGRFLGKSETYPAWVQYFSARIQAGSRDAVVREWVSRLAPGIGSGAFHGVIRTAYALESGSAAELAAALAYWAAAYEPLHQFSQASGKKKPAEVLAQIAADLGRAGKRLPGRNIADRMVAASRLREFGGWVASADPARLDLDSLAATVIRAYAASGDFTILHAVTGTHATRALLRHVESPTALVGALWRALLAAYVGVGAPATTGWSLQGDDKLDWPAIHERACRCDDEHDVKITYSCWRGWQWTGDDIYRRVASTVVTRPNASVAA